MAHPDLTDLRALVPPAAARAFADGDDRLTATLLQRARDTHPPGTLAWAVLERLLGLAFIHVQREVEGTFALERADAILDRTCPPGGLGRPDLDWLDLDGLDPDRSEAGEPGPT
ncbi:MULTISPECIES: hypothetical protein [unclassified Deinococcus]|uniref:hypothetical protein n=1 Tax=unclassified Deinococcus TaxID=2623546 RepID=UPI001E520057|nr:hypothetical protein [Deinococcus sp. 12RED42]